MSYILSCCSTVDLTKEHLEKINVSYTCFHFILDGVEYPAISSHFSEWYKIKCQFAE